jgi:hypothetical protein
MHKKDTQKIPTHISESKGACVPVTKQVHAHRCAGPKNVPAGVNQFVLTVTNPPDGETFLPGS